MVTAHSEPRRLATICARGGSKGLPGKNLAVIAGRSLLSIAIHQARRAGVFASISVSSDNAEILSEAERAGADLLIERPAELATDSCGKLGAIVHLAAAAEQATSAPYHTVVDLDVTCPLRPPSIIRSVVATSDGEGCASVLTAALARRSPYFNLVEIDAEGRVGVCKRREGIESRQAAPRTFDLYGTVYAWRRDRLLAEPQLFYPSSRIHIMPPELALDIDTAFDLEVARLLIESGTVDAGLS